MSSRSAVRSAVLAVAGTAVVVAAVALLKPGLRRSLLSRIGKAHVEPEQPTHIVLPDRVLPDRLPQADWGEEMEQAIEEGREVGSDVALTGA